MQQVSDYADEDFLLVFEVMVKRGSSYAKFPPNASHANVIGALFIDYF